VTTVLPLLACFCPNCWLRHAAGQRLRGKSLQERAFASKADAQARSGGARHSSSPSGSDVQQPTQHNSAERPLQPAAARPQCAGCSETEATSAVRSSAAGEPAQAAAPHQQRQHHAPLQHQLQHQPQHQQHHHQPRQQQQQHREQNPAVQQKAILPGVLASLVQAQRSLQVHPASKPSRPPLGPSAPSKRHCVDGAGAGPAADGCREGVATSHPQSSILQQRPSHRLAMQQQQREQQQRLAAAAQRRNGAQPGSGWQPGRRQLSVKVPLAADPMHMTLHSFFSRRRQLLAQLGRRPSRYQRPPQAGPLSGLLALPEDVLVGLYWSSH